MFFSKKGEQPKEQNQEKTIGFEPEDKPTPTAGKILLILMAILLIFLGFQGLRDVENLPKKPERLSTCAGQLSYYINPTTCQFSKYEIAHKVPDYFNEANSVAQELDLLQKKKSTLEQQIFQLDKQIRENQTKYDLSLQEIQADETRVGQTPEQLRSVIQNLEETKKPITTQLLQTQSQIAQINPRLASANANLKIATEAALKDYEKDNAKYKLWVFLIQAILVFPIFFIFLKLYLHLKAKDSPHTVIATTLLGVSGIFVLFITIGYLWDVFLAKLLETVAELFLNIPLFRTLIYYVGMLLVIAVFGGAVYTLQKKIFNPTRVRLRRLRAHKCPYCEFPFDYSKSFCPSCGKKLMEACASCSKERYLDMKYCPHCGKP